MKYEEAPDRCPNNHLLIGGRCLVGWEVCGCPAAAAKNSGHRTFFCRLCGETVRIPPCSGPQPQADRWFTLPNSD
ncbi:hypothetical protein [Rhodococcus sp. USK13]|uniref:hypothetical protein n=1 Tax=Rhodococcus sp. USK13 TaxID=2806442 RepID=UPI001BCA90C3|nr:hypothetical protein [Rhodococcus sp. USK13]